MKRAETRQNRVLFGTRLLERGKVAVSAVELFFQFYCSGSPESLQWHNGVLNLKSNEGILLVQGNPCAASSQGSCLSEAMVVFRPGMVLCAGRKHVESHNATEKFPPLFPFCGFCNNLSKEPYKPLSSSFFKTWLLW